MLGLAIAVALGGFFLMKRAQRSVVVRVRAVSTEKERGD